MRAPARGYYQLTAAGQSVVTLQTIRILSNSLFQQPQSDTDSLVPPTSLTPRFTQLLETIHSELVMGINQSARIQSMPCQEWLDSYSPYYLEVWQELVDTFIQRLGEILAFTFVSQNQFVLLPFLPDGEANSEYTRLHDQMDDIIQSLVSKLFQTYPDTITLKLRELFTYIDQLIFVQETLTQLSHDPEHMKAILEKVKPAVCKPTEPSASDRPRHEACQLIQTSSTNP